MNEKTITKPTQPEQMKAIGNEDAEQKAASKEYKPTRSAWYLSIFLASGFGVGSIELVKYGFKELHKKDFKLELVDIWCRDKSCTFTVINSGDESGVMTAFSIDTEKDLNDQFRSTHPVGYTNLKRTDKLKVTSVAFLPPKTVIDIEFTNPTDYFPKKQICLFGREKKWCTSGKELNNLVFKEFDRFVE